MEYIFHEKQEGSLCAQHCLNALLQGDYFSAVDLATIAAQMDEVERQHMAEGGVNSDDYQKFIQQPSENMDDSGYFSVQVIEKALEVWGLELAPYNSSHPNAQKAHSDPVSCGAFICNYRDHWLTVRKLGNQWFNLNSLLSGPVLISDTYLAMFLTQLQVEGYSIFVAVGELPKNEADEVLKLLPVVQTDKTKNSAATKKTKSEVCQTDEDQDIQTALRLSLEEADDGLYSGNSSSVNPQDVRQKRQQFLDSISNVAQSKASGSSRDSETATKERKESPIKRVESMTEEEMLEAALKMSMDSCS